MRYTRIALFALLIIATVAAAGANDARAIASVTPRSSTINPTLGDSVSVVVDVRRRGIADVDVIDRDGYVVRTLTHQTPIAKGAATFAWDGRDAAGHVVPDEAYSFRVGWSDGASRETYFPADEPASMVALQADYYSARTATLAYTLAVPSRVHIQAGTVVKDPKTGEMAGPVLKTIVNREPRAAGRVAEAWSGQDESGLIRVADLQDFVISIAAVPLPEGSVVTYGNRTQTFAEAALTRAGESIFTKRRSHGHHAGLPVLDDVSPRMEIRPLNGSWSEEERAWRVVGSKVRLEVSLSGPSASSFARQPAQVYRFIDGKLISITKRPPKSPAKIEIDLLNEKAPQIVALNWRSDYGGVAVNAIRIVRTGANP